VNLDEATIVNVPLVVNVWIVCHPLVVIVPPVEEVDTPSLPSVAYEIITTQEPPLAPVKFHCPAPQPPPPVFAVPLVGVPQVLPFHPHPFHQFPIVAPHTHQPPPPA